MVRAGGRRRRGLVVVGVVVLVLAVVLAGCGAADDDDTLLEGRLTPLGERLPSSIRDTRIITVGSDISYAPFEFFVEGDSQGVDVDLCQAIAERFGSVTCQFEDSEFDGILQALQDERFDIVMSAITDTRDRQAEADFVDYFTAGSSILVGKGNPRAIRSVNDLCGTVVGVQQGTTGQGLAERQAAACADSGRPALDLRLFKQDSAVRQRLAAGELDADITDYPVAAWAARTSGGGLDFEVVTGALDPGPYGIAVDKNETALRDLIQEALRAVIADGTYDRVLQKWGVQAGALRSATVNAGVGSSALRPDY